MLFVNYISMRQQQLLAKNKQKGIKRIINKYYGYMLTNLKTYIKWTN